MYVYLGSVIGDLATIASEPGSGGDAAWWIKVGGLVVTVVVTVLVTRVAQRALAAASDVDGAGQRVQ